MSSAAGAGVKVMFPDASTPAAIGSATTLYSTAHHSWMSFLVQSMAPTYAINGKFITVNAAYPGLIASTTDFGHNEDGIFFNETTHHNTYTEAKIDALWMLWRAALAEQFAGSIDEFFELVSLEPSGTHMNGYMVVDAKTREIGLVEMSYRSFVFLKSADGAPWAVTTKPEGLSTEYDAEDHAGRRGRRQSRFGCRSGRRAARRAGV
jgi:hypothetical protein